MTFLPLYLRWERTYRSTVSRNDDYYDKQTAAVWSSKYYTNTTGLEGTDGQLLLWTLRWQHCWRSFLLSTPPPRLWSQNFSWNGMLIHVTFIIIDRNYNSYTESKQHLESMRYDEWKEPLTKLAIKVQIWNFLLLVRSFRLSFTRYSINNTDCCFQPPYTSEC